MWEGRHRIKELLCYLCLGITYGYVGECRKKGRYLLWFTILLIMQTLSPKKVSPIAWVPTVYFAMGLPVVMISDVFLLMFKDFGIPDREITFMASLLILPWSLKPLFSPLMEIYGTPKLYVVLTEFVSALILGVIAAAMGMEGIFGTCVALMAVMAIGGTIHDIAGDGTYMEQLDRSQQSRYMGWQGASYNIAKVLAKGGLVFMAGKLSMTYGVVNSWRIVFVISAAIMLAIALHHLFILPGRGMPVSHGGERSGEEKSIRYAMRQFWDILSSFFRKKHILIYVIFILLYRFTEGFAIKVAPLFLKADRSVGGLGLTNAQYGLIYSTVGIVAFVMGSIISGYFIERRGLKRVLLTLILTFHIPFIVYFLLATFTPGGIGWTALGLALEQFGYGFGFVGLSLFMMQQVAPGPHRMAHYAIANSLMNLSFVLPGLVSGAVSDAFGYRTFFLIALIVAIPAIVCATRIPFTHHDDDDSTDSSSFTPSSHKTA